MRGKTFTILVFLAVSAPARAELGVMIGAGPSGAADVAISRQQAAVQMHSIDRQADVSEYVAGLSAQTSLAMAHMTADARLREEAGKTDRLGLQLGLQRETTQANLAAYLEQLNKEYDLKNRELDMKLQLAEWQNELKAIQSGTATLFTSLNSGASMPVGSYGITNPNNGAAPAARLIASATQPDAPARGIRSPKRKSKKIGTPVLSIGRTRAFASNHPQPMDWPRHESRTEVPAPAASAHGHGHHHH